MNLNLTTYDTNECRQDKKCVNKAFNYGNEVFSTSDDKTLVSKSRECACDDMVLIMLSILQQGANVVAFDKQEQTVNFRAVNYC